jgi:hypothetical protein
MRKRKKTRRLPRVHTVEVRAPFSEVLRIIKKRIYRGFPGSIVVRRIPGDYVRVEMYAPTWLTK